MQITFGDQSLLSWLVFAVYFVVVVWIWVATKKVDSRERGFLLLNLLALLALGLNKQLDIQTDLINLAKQLAQYAGLYSHKTALKQLFVLFVGAGVTTAIIVFVALFWRLFFKYAFVFIGWLCLFIFIVLRVAYFEHDAFRGASLWQYEQYFQLIELTGLLLIGLAIKRA